MNMELDNPYAVYEMPNGHPVSMEEARAKKEITASGRRSIKVVVSSCFVVLVLIAIPVALHFYQQVEWNRVLDEQSTKYSNLLAEANEKLISLENKTEWDSQSQNYSELSKAMLEVNKHIQALENKSEENMEINTELSKSLMETQERLQNNSEAFDEQLTKYSNLLAAANEKISNLESKTDSCPMKYNGKCFWIEYREPGITIEEGPSICSAEGGRLADIYSSTHYYMLLRYLRMFCVSDGYTHAWIGMTYDSSTNTVFLSDGTRAPFVKWYPGHPRSSYTSNMYVDVHRDWENVNQHLANARSTATTLHGAICEK